MNSYFGNNDESGHEGLVFGRRGKFERPMAGFLPDKQGKNNDPYDHNLNNAAEKTNQEKTFFNQQKTAVISSGFSWWRCPR